MYIYTYYDTYIHTYIYIYIYIYITVLHCIRIVYGFTSFTLSTKQQFHRQHTTLDKLRFMIAVNYFCKRDPS